MKNKKIRQLIATAMITTTLSATVPTAINPTVAFASETVYNTEQDAANADLELT
ncbi:hypothetical protein [Clostridium beijerinckii]|uniref:hypothetical protein n=1 Tax=Clostridium beijerinckii TaxID=1520 RepID=UPI000A64E84C|nr:hypothetical protein [Clostridium beijerinckii]